MEFNEYMRIRKRITKAGDDGGCGQVDCHICPLSCANNGLNVDCTKLERMYPEKAEEIIKKWAKEHPVKSRQRALLNLFPNFWSSNGVIAVCPQQAEQYFHCPASSSKISCNQCREEYWLGEYEEPKGEDKK